MPLFKNISLSYKPYMIYILKFRICLGFHLNILPKKCKEITFKVPTCYELFKINLLVMGAMV